MKTTEPTPQKVEAFLKKVAIWGRDLAEVERDLLAHLLENSRGLLVRPKQDGDGFWARWAERQY